MNPYERLLMATGMSKAAFQRYAGVSKQTVNGIMTGKSSSISMRMNTALGKLCHSTGVDAKQILQDEYRGRGLAAAYKAWRRESRRAFVGAFDDIQVVPETGNLSPVWWFVRDAEGGLQTFCKKYKVQLSVLQRYLVGDAASVPEDLQEFLEDVQYAHRHELVNRQMLWKERQ